MAINENEFDNTSCSICRDDLKTDFIQAISTCGHVFHGLCLQQWIEYCIAKDRTCPLCNQNFSQEEIIRLYFQSTGDAIDSQKQPEEKAAQDDDRRRLEDKVLGLTSSYEHQNRKLKDTIEELNELQDKFFKRNYSFAQQQRELRGLSEELRELKQIIKVVEEIEANKIEISDAKSRVKDILEEHPELVSDFNSLISKIRIAQNFKKQLRGKDDRVFDLMLDLERMYQKKRLSMSEFYREATILLRHHPVLLHDFKQFFEVKATPTIENVSTLWSIRMKPKREEMLFSVRK
ncbi:hypothetical protein MKX01_038455 [Papaver californicum]|nr:hypothetical protein MKX01_038455 [Papaver californicum]